MKTKIRTLTLALSTGLVLFAAGCDKKPTEPTAGEKLDSAIADVKQNAHEAGDTIERKADSLGQTIDDAAITTSVKAKLLAADDLKGLDISVDTVNGVVKLTGKVASADARDHAVRIAHEVDGVSGVSDDLSVQ